MASAAKIYLKNNFSNPFIILYTLSKLRSTTEQTPSLVYIKPQMQKALQCRDC
jgi:hypothetical protein